MRNMFFRATLSTDNYNSLLNGWSQLALQPNINFHGGYSKYSLDASDARANIIDSFNWNITDGGLIESADTTPPTITLLGASTLSIIVGDNYMDAGATADDDTDGNITDNIIIANLVDATTEGTYIVTYDVNDSSGNSATQVTRTVSVIPIEDIYADWSVAKDGSVNDAVQTVGVNTMKVLIEPGYEISENDTSVVDFVYGKINGTYASIGINEKYANGTKMVVRIYDANGNILATSEELTYAGSGNDVEFNDINF